MHRETNTINKNKLKAKMIENNYNAMQLAKKMGIGSTSMSYKMNGYKPFNLEEIKKIVELLQLTNDDIISVFFKINREEVK